MGFVWESTYGIFGAKIMPNILKLLIFRFIHRTEHDRASKNAGDKSTYQRNDRKATNTKT